ncbi:LysE family translocator [Actinophytocola oryzae]|uniref:Threonine/homoserine/homoserine lactone efflux protein n=1 Tax=Actinophytocola oryzae TaxID=502181 RepID=A0A4V3FS65_9PSEU|nr:LysE family translocator [Actinophytocola oryzae]TDV46271.1 threonine/homoserine/homoserine lactone efflux protein [Actinophytocola oryzae]
MELSIVLAFAVACVVISVVPGPDMMFIMANGIARGRRTGVVAAAGMSTGMLGHTVAAALGLGALLQAAPVALEAVRIAGAVFLVYMAITTLRSAKDVARTAPARFGERSLRRTFAMATLVNLSNPKVVFFYLAFFPQFVTEGGWPVPVQFLVMGGVLIVVGFSVDATVGLVSGTLSKLLLSRPAIQRWLNRVSAAIFGGLAVRLVADR